MSQPFGTLAARWGDGLWQNDGVPALLHASRPQVSALDSRRMVFGVALTLSSFASLFFRTLSPQLEPCGLSQLLFFSVIPLCTWIHICTVSPLRDY